MLLYITYSKLTDVVLVCKHKQSHTYILKFSLICSCSSILLFNILHVQMPQVLAIKVLKTFKSVNFIHDFIDDDVTDENEIYIEQKEDQDGRTGMFNLLYYLIVA